MEAKLKKNLRIVLTASLMALFLLEVFEALPIFEVSAPADSALSLAVSGQFGISPSEPIRSAEIRLYSVWEGEWTVPGATKPIENYVQWTELAAISQTDENGEFNIEVPYESPRHAERLPPGVLGNWFGVFVELWARSAAVDVRFQEAHEYPGEEDTYTIRNPVAAAGLNSYVLIDTIAERAIAMGQPIAFINIGYAEAPSRRGQDDRGAYRILNMINDAWNFLADLTNNPVEPPQVIVGWDSSNDVRSMFTNQMIHIKDNEADAGTVLHEYGHFIAERYQFDNSGGGEHHIHVNDYFAWSEGWANLFQYTVRRIVHGESIQMGLSALEIVRNPDTYIDRNVEDYVGSDNEGAVLRLLWDMSESFGFESIWDVCYNLKPKTIHELWDGWFSTPRPVSARPVMNSIFFEHGIDKNQKPTCTVIFPNGGERLDRRVVVEAEACDFEGRTIYLSGEGSVAFVEFELGLWIRDHFAWGRLGDWRDYTAELGDWRDYIGKYFISKTRSVLAGPTRYLYSVTWHTEEDIVYCQRVSVRARAKDVLGRWVDSDGNGIVDDVVDLFSDWDMCDAPFTVDNR